MHPTASKTAQTVKTIAWTCRRVIHSLSTSDGARLEAHPAGGVAAGRAPRERQGRLPTPPRYGGQVDGVAFGQTFGSGTSLRGAEFSTPGPGVSLCSPPG